MKKSILLLLLAVCMLFSGCSNAFAKEDYNNDSKIASTNRYAAQKSSILTKNGNVSAIIEKFDGYETIWESTEHYDLNVVVIISLSLSSGTAKLVLVDGDNNVTTLAEQSANGHTMMKLKKGENKIKLVGYDCENVEVKITFGEVTAR